ncbi:MAG: hypothetical protein N2385_07325 [Chloroflexus sp.]|nr:hypothetical protein [Chloroflexus sp.]
MQNPIDPKLRQWFAQVLEQTPPAAEQNRHERDFQLVVEEVKLSATQSSYL